MNRNPLLLIGGVFGALVCAACLVDREPPHEGDGKNLTTTTLDGVVTPKVKCQGVKCPEGSSSGGPDSDAGMDASNASDASDASLDAAKDAYVDPKDEPPPDTFGWVDLLPIKSTASDGSSTFCPRDKEGALVVKIKNAGTMASGATTTYVTFATGDPAIPNVALPTPSILGGDIAVLRTPIPSMCFTAGSGNCTFSIMADQNLNVSEWDESNNYVVATCIGAAAKY